MLCDIVVDGDNNILEHNKICFPKLTFKCQNVNSMNISTRNPITLQKVLAIVKSKDDIIFLNDLRLNIDSQKSGAKDLEKKFNLIGYNCFFNSKSSARGVGVLISKKIAYTVITIDIDTKSNIILVKLKIIKLYFNLRTK